MGDCVISKHLLGRTIESFEIGDHEWCWVRLTDDYVISFGTLIRFVGADGGFFTGCDHGQQFGLPSPFDAEAAFRGQLIGKTVERIEVCEDTGDLTIHVSSGRLEIVCNSSGYEAYQINGPDDLIIVCMGGQQGKSK